MKKCKKCKKNKKFSEKNRKNVAGMLVLWFLLKYNVYYI